MIGLEKNSCHFVIQSEVKPKPILTCSQAFSHTLHLFHVLAWSFDWFTGVSMSFVIDYSRVVLVLQIENCSKLHHCQVIQLLLFLLDLMFIICWLLHPDPRWRATITDVEENDWINQPVDITKYSFDAVLGQF